MEAFIFMILGITFYALAIASKIKLDCNTICKGGKSNG